jgi:hypothetical protein
MQLDGYCLKWNNRLYIFRVLSEHNRPYSNTSRWKEAEFYYDFYPNVPQNEILSLFGFNKEDIPFQYFGKPKTPKTILSLGSKDKLPLSREKSNKFKEKLEQKDLKLDDFYALGIISKKDLEDSSLWLNKDSSVFESINSNPLNSSITSRSNFSEENHDVHQKPKKSRIPVRSNSNSNISLLSNNSSLSHSDLFQSSKIPVRKKNGKNVLLEPKVYEINEKTREALLSVDHPFLKNISKNKIYEAISFHSYDRVRVKNLEDKDIAELRNYKEPMMIFSR